MLSLAAPTVAGTVMITHYSDAQCPCSARVPSDAKKTFLDNPDFAGQVDFTQYFVGSLTKNVHKCIHGEAECVAQRHFACAQNMSTVKKLSHLDSSKWLDFEACSYGVCTNCPAIEGKHCPCANYTNFQDFEHNDIMKNCAAKVGLDWAQLNACGTGPQGDALMAASATRSNNDGVTYGVDGLAPIFVNGVKVATKKPIPIVCGPTPDEVLPAVCAELQKQGGTVPVGCSKASDAGSP
jgi:hypothetical protein